MKAETAAKSASVGARNEEEATHLLDGNRDVLQLLPDAVLELLDIDALGTLGIVDVLRSDAPELPLRGEQHVVLLLSCCSRPVAQPSTAAADIGLVLVVLVKVGQLVVVILVEELSREGYGLCGGRTVS